MKTFDIRCPAKINLSLDVVSRRADGYHNLSMIMHQINLFDILTLEMTEGNGIILTSTDPSVPTDDSNLIIKAAKTFFEKTGISASARIHLHKSIPMGAGLGGGSTDAAGTLTALNTMFDTPLTIDELAVTAKTLGADVPFFLHGGCMLAEGIGEILSPLPPLSNVYILLAKPSVSVSTAYVYKNLVLDESIKHPDTKSAITALETGDLDLLASSCGNVLETVTAIEYPEIEEYKNILLSHGAAYSLMSGSGSSVFGIFADKKSAETAYNNFKNITPFTYLV